MYTSPIRVTRLDHRIDPDPSCVIARPFIPGGEARIRGIIERILEIPEDSALDMLDRLEAHFRINHPEIEEILLEHFDEVEPYLPSLPELSDKRKRLIGAYFTMEYALEAAALFNPSMVPAFDQSGLPVGSTRFLMSLRATGEGHISSIVFRQGVIHEDHRIIIETGSHYRRPLKVRENRTYPKKTYAFKLREMEGENPLADQVLAGLGDEFTFKELCSALETLGDGETEPPAVMETREDMLSLARANYQIVLPDDVDVSAAVIFPHSENESRGLEDLRLVRFKEEDGTGVLYGTYTAYNGFHIIPQMIEVRGERDNINIHTLSGKFVQNKGMALFPRKVGGQYMMSGRIDNENLYIMKSDHVLVWNHAEVVQTPKFPWELVQLGNCGSPLETEEGWLLLTHGVGPMRQYCIGAVLLDLEDPTKIIRQTSEPLMVPRGEERHGYVPNVVYSCGAMIHNDVLIIPYAMSDISSSFAIISLEELLRME
ncbi:MAG: glycosidase [Planctomycetes bacterium]|nr:glycosidase [Planctomycetota bacterium]